jgi:leucine dehydrogenase
MLIGVHSTVLGPGMGGTRLKVYPGGLAAAITDVTRLSSAMTMKQAVAGLPFGGGKAVLAVPEVPAEDTTERRDLLRRYAALVEGLGGAYVTAADMNTGPADMNIIGEVTSHVLGRSPDRGGSGDPGEGTATGVFHGIVASVAHVFDDEDLRGRRVLIQGVGSVGGRLAVLLAEAGAQVLISDFDDALLTEVAAVSGARVVPAGEALATPCDILSPCAIGGVLNATTIPGLRCRVVAGAANNQLADPDLDAQRLAAAGIAYAPDYVINAGGVLHLAGYEWLGWSEQEMAQRLRGIGETVSTIFEMVDREGGTTTQTAARLARERLEEGRPRV